MENIIETFSLFYSSSENLLFLSPGGMLTEIFLRLGNAASKESTLDEHSQHAKLDVLCCSGSINGQFSETEGNAPKCNWRKGSRTCRGIYIWRQGLYIIKSRYIRVVFMP